MICASVIISSKMNDFSQINNQTQWHLWCTMQIYIDVSLSIENCTLKNLYWILILQYKWTGLYWPLIIHFSIDLFHILKMFTYWRDNWVYNERIGYELLHASCIYYVIYRCVITYKCMIDEYIIIQIYVQMSYMYIFVLDYKIQSKVHIYIRCNSSIDSLLSPIANY